jgi:hypothetical protein
LLQLKEEAFGATMLPKLIMVETAAGRWEDIYKLYITTDITVETAAGGCLPTSTNCT